ncbi:MAG: hypothetical protein E6R07_00300 [Nevskiaceae bacterium]|nr:MAG: hypothetical protein E6R07_00300 [Nevskiaceae bacterium]
MNVQASTRRRALLDIYRSHRKPRGGRLSLRELERDWKGTGLRRADLELALREMTQRRLLLMLRGHEGAVYELTYLGACAMERLLAGDPLAAAQDWWTLRRARRRVRPQAETYTGPRNRRADDAPAAAPAHGDPLVRR